MFVLVHILMLYAIPLKKSSTGRLWILRTTVGIQWALSLYLMRRCDEGICPPTIWLRVTLVMPNSFFKKRQENCILCWGGGQKQQKAFFDWSPPRNYSFWHTLPTWSILFDLYFESPSNWCDFGPMSDYSFLVKYDNEMQVKDQSIC